MQEIIDFMIFESSFGYNCSECGSVMITFENAYEYDSGDILQVECAECGCINNIEIE